MIDAFARKIAVGIKNANPDHPASVEVMRFALASIFVNFGIVVLSVIVAWPLEHVPEVLLALAAFYVLRTLSGGYHLNSSMACLYLTAATVNVIPFIALPNPVILVMTILSVVLAYLFSPSNMENRNRIPPRFYPALKLVSMLLIAVNLFFYSDIVAICFILQCASLIRIRR